jgi:hypothetical protein
LDQGQESQTATLFLDLVQHGGKKGATMQIVMAEESDTVRKIIMTGNKVNV